MTRSLRLQISSVSAAVVLCAAAAMLSGVARAGALSPATSAAVATASARSSLKPPALPEGSAYESLGDDVRIQGLALAAWVFDAPGTVQQMTAWFSNHQPALRDMWVVPGGVVLGGIDGSVQWVVRMSGAGSNRTRGTVSALSLGTPDRPAFGGQARHGYIELKGATPVFELQMRESGHTVVQQVWTHASAPAQACGSMQALMGQAGWRAASVQDSWGGHGCGNWTRASSSLSLMAVPLEAGSGISAVLRIKDTDKRQQ